MRVRGAGGLVGSEKPGEKDALYVQSHKTETASDREGH